MLRILAVLSLVISGINAQLVIPESFLSANEQDLMPDQVIIGGGENDDYTTRTPMLSDILAIESRGSIFYDYARESATFSSILSGEQDGQYTVFVPTNKAVMTLPRKPHQGKVRRPEIDLPIEITEQEADKESLRNVEKWVGAHIVQGKLVSKASLVGSHQTLNEKKTIEITDSGTEKWPEWSNLVVEGKIQILSARDAGNGVLYVIEGTIEL